MIEQKTDQRLTMRSAFWPLDCAGWVCDGPSGVSGSISAAVTAARNDMCWSAPSKAEVPSAADACGENGREQATAYDLLGKTFGIE